MAKRIGYALLGLVILGVAIGRYTAFSAATFAPVCAKPRPLSGASASPIPDLAAAPILPASATAAGQPALDPSVRGGWRGQFDTPLIALARANPTARLPVERIRLTLSPRESATILIDHFEAAGDSEGVFEGVVEGKPGSTVILSYVGLAQAGMVHLPAEGRAFRIRGTDDGAVRITEVDLHRAPECANCIAAVAAQPLSQP
jgi:hypothetical protein